MLKKSRHKSKQANFDDIREMTYLDFPHSLSLLRLPLVFKRLTIFINCLNRNLMSFNLIDEAKSLLPSDLISRAATSLGETESGIQRAINGSIPTVLSGLLNQSSTTGASGILDMVRNASGSNILGNITGLLSGSSISGIGSTVMGWLRSLFGDRLSSVTNSLASFAGIKPSSASSVMSLATPAVLGSVGNYAKENNLTASGLGSFLMTQKNSILNAIPSGFNLAGALGLSSLSDIGSRISSTVSSASNYAASTVKRTSGKMALVPVAITWRRFTHMAFYKKTCPQRRSCSSSNRYFCHDYYTSGHSAAAGNGKGKARYCHRKFYL
jgi:hypothetical protein